MRSLYLEQQNSIGKSLISTTLAIGYESVLDHLPTESEYHLWNTNSLNDQLRQVADYKVFVLELVETEIILIPDLNHKMINLEHITSIKQLHNLFTEILNFPKFYGENWDAFWDTITGLVEMPNHLTITHFDKFHTIFTKDAILLKEIINEFNKISSDRQIEIRNYLHY